MMMNNSGSSSIMRLLSCLLFKLVQITVAAFFTLLVFAQTFLAGLGRLFGEPAAKQKVVSARQQQQGSAAVLGDKYTAEVPTIDPELHRQQQNDGIRHRASVSQQQQGDDCAAAYDGFTASPCTGPGGSHIHIFPQPELGAQQQQPQQQQQQ
jgi:hypothetical protein